ncbi:MAG: hypothetical protein GF344_15150 [Chitinivibrionales bacterium]|nr:hypothetical protein [Chitinivibrionales bacterium]MBD3358044.1 hypothetical protein [Chitinivibrionales bacterium]
MGALNFDWSLEKLLRSKANCGIHEGFLSELLRDDISILEILDSESNKDNVDDNFNRVDLLVKNRRDEINITEILYDYEYDFLLRMLYNTGKTNTEHIKEKESYGRVKKIISINILYSDLGMGDDYANTGTTRFNGMHCKDELQLIRTQKERFGKQCIHELYPEYYLLKVNRFGDVFLDTADQWIYFLKNEEIRPEFTAKGLYEVVEKLDVMKHPPEERAAYERYLENLRYVTKMPAAGMTDRNVHEMSGLPPEAIREIRSPRDRSRG